MDNSIEKYNALYDKIEAIHLMNGSLSSFFYERNIKTITIIGNLELSRIVSIDFTFKDLVYTPYIYIYIYIYIYTNSDSNGVSDRLKFLNKNLKVRLLNEQNKIDINHENILICSLDDDYLKYVNLKNNKNIFKIESVVNSLYSHCFYYLPLKRISENNNVPICILNGVNAKSVVNKSENEKFLVENGITEGSVSKMLKDIPPFIPEAIKEISDDVNYAELVTAGRTIEKEGNVYKVHDISNPYVNVKNGIRRTTDQPEEFDGIVYFFGHSVIFGRGAEDKDTIESHLQRLLNEFAKKERKKPKLVLNCSNTSSTDYLKMFPYMETYKFTENDIIVVSSYDGDRSNIYKEFYFCRPLPMFERPHDDGEVFVDRVHLNSKGNLKIAKYLLDTFISNDLLKPNISNMNTKKNISYLGNNHFTNKYGDELLKYKKSILEIHKNQIGRIGSIVMNCNPFTNGHKYLIETAASQVDILYVFVVEEDKSIFSFKERIALVEKCASNLTNVKVLPSGQFIISSVTFQDYFDKAEIQDKKIDPTFDVELFALEIAPIMGISVRFAGEEPIDMVTKQYNDTMREVLPRYGIEFIEIKRKDYDGYVISASRVRSLLEKKNFEEIKEIVPTDTYEYLVSKFNNDLTVEQ